MDLLFRRVREIEKYLGNLEFEERKKKSRKGYNLKRSLTDCRKRKKISVNMCVKLSVDFNGTLDFKSLCVKLKKKTIYYVVFAMVQ